MERHKYLVCDQKSVAARRFCRIENLKIGFDTISHDCRGVECLVREQKKIPPDSKKANLTVGVGGIRNLGIEVQDSR